MHNNVLFPLMCHEIDYMFLKKMKASVFFLSKPTTNSQFNKTVANNLRGSQMEFNVSSNAFI